MEWLRRHIIELLLGMIISIGGYTGKLELDGIRQDLQEHQCGAAKFSTENAFDQIELGLIGESLDDLKSNAHRIQDMRRSVEFARQNLTGCNSKETEALLTNLESLYRALMFYVTKDYENAEKCALEMDPQRAITHQLLGSARLKLAERPEHARDKAGLQAESAEHFKTAADRVVSELGGSVRDVAILRLECASLMCRKTPEADEDAITRLLALKGLGVADHNTFYNLSCLYSRQKKLELALREMNACVNCAGSKFISQSDIHDDHDFDNILADKEYAARFHLIVQKFPLSL
jgi:hypothetical protein